MKQLCLLIISVLFFHSTAFTQSSPSEVFQPRLGILDTYNGHWNGRLSDLRSVKHMAEVGGMPFTISDNLQKILTNKVVIIPSELKSGVFSTEELSLLQNYVLKGGCLITNGLDEEKLYSTFGITDVIKKKERYTLSFDISADGFIFHNIDDEMEQTISLGNKEKEKSVRTNSFVCSEAGVLGRYDNGQVAFIRNTFGKGKVYSLGILFKHLILSAQINADNAHRCYSNCFEPTSDVVIMLLKNIYAQEVPYAVFKNTAPTHYRATLIITHDVCSHTAQNGMKAFADLERELGIKATYMITTHEFRDDLASNNYEPHRHQVKEIADMGMEIGSHSYGHFPDFADKDIFPMGSIEYIEENIYHPRYIDNNCIGGSVIGETYVSKKLLERDTDQKIRSFRSGHLAYNKHLTEALQTTGYSYNSSYASGDVMTAFPYTETFDCSYSGTMSNILEIPLLISDVFDEEAISADNYLEKVDIWLDAANKVADNKGFICLLIHPNRDYKVWAEREFYKQLPKDICALTLGEAGDFWTARNKTRFRTQIVEHNMEIIIPDSLYPLHPDVSFIINNGNAFEKVILKTESGNFIDNFIVEKLNEEDGIVLFSENGTTGIQDNYQETNLRCADPYPNPTKGFINFPFTIKNQSDIELRLYDLTGKPVLYKNMPDQIAGTHQVPLDLNHLREGIYFYSLSDGEQIQAGKIIVK